MESLNETTSDTPVKKYTHRYAYLNAYAKRKYNEDEEFRLAKIAKVKRNTLLRKERQMAELLLKVDSLQYNIQCPNITS